MLTDTKVSTPVTMLTQIGRIYEFTALDFHLPINISTSLGTPFIIAVVAAPILNECDVNPFEFHPRNFAAFLSTA